MHTVTKILKSHGLRVTQPRLAVIKLLSLKPQTARSLLKQLQQNGLSINRVTVYRTLNNLYQINLINKTQILGQPTSYELSSSKHHHHIVCNVCGDMQDITFPENILIPNVTQQTGYQVTDHIVEFAGVCARCQ